MHLLRLLILIIGIIWNGLAYAGDEDEDEMRSKKGLVLVEPASIVTTEVQEEYSLVPYRERRHKWGTTYSLGYSSYEPVNYEPDFVPVDFSQVYKSPEMPLIELAFCLKRNFSLGSFGIELAAGMYKNQSDNVELSDSSLSLTPIRFGGVMAFDAVSPEPYAVPYVKGGMYSILFKEELSDGSSNNGNTQLAPYFSGGVALGLGWIDRDGARLAFNESGIEATYAYVEAQMFMVSSSKEDGDFSNDVSYAGGVKIEF